MAVSVASAVKTPRDWIDHYYEKFEAGIPNGSEKETEARDGLLAKIEWLQERFQRLEQVGAEQPTVFDTISAMRARLPNVL
ncbi:unnamed protein product, partial [Mesorhabditis spiculigera]